MTDAELDEVETALGRPLPADYRQFVRRCPVADWNRYCNYLYVSPKRLIRENQGDPTPHNDIRESDGAGGVRVRTWPTDWTVIGDGDSEWYTFVRPDAPGLWEWDHETREVTQVAASFDEYLEQQREKIGSPPALKVTRHPTLGELTWNPESRVWRVKVAGANVVLKPKHKNSKSLPPAAAERVPAAVAAEPRVFADAMTAGGWAEFLDLTAGDHGLTADTIRTRMSRPTLTITPEPGVEYQYSPDDEFDLIVFWIRTDAHLAVVAHGWA
jgi:hypothetical protein